MLPKAPSSTTSSKSSTNKPASKSATLDTPIQYLKGVGPRLAELFALKDVRTLKDAIYYLPRDYQDRSQVKKISEMKAGEPALVFGTIISHRVVPMRNRKRSMLEAVLDDGSGMRLSLKWFQFSRGWMEKKLAEKPRVILFGTANVYNNRLEVVHPDIQWDVEENEVSESGGVVAIYSETEGLNQKIIRKVVESSLETALQLVTDDLPSRVREAYGLLPIKDVLKTLHHPPKTTTIDDLKNFKTPEYKRLVFEELFKFEWVIGKRRLGLRSEETKAYRSEQTDELVGKVKKMIPFELTSEQVLAFEKIHEDLAQPKPMNRLLQGDVGCGKTLVSFLSCLPVLACGGQAAIMAPTEILAEQHFLNASKYLFGIAKVELLVGSTTKSKREEILARLASGDIDILIGTHALIENPVIFKELGLVVIDEQHRFGVDQRMKLRSKGRHPHVLSMTATPIPRTLALTAYGDLDVTTIKELPKGRAKIATKIFRTGDRDAALLNIKSEVAKGRQAYIIYPLVEESEKIDLANAVEGAEELANGVFAGTRVGLLHGKMSAKEKSSVMDSFKKGETKVLVSTTVVEVGVDVPNATVLMIEHAERFGLSQLHQLRGRVGRGTHDSYCFLMNHGGGDVSYERLKAMEETRDGFKLAELDLEIRGPGEFLGTRQSGDLNFKFANLVRDQAILEQTRKSAFGILQTDPNLLDPDNAPLRKYMEQTGHLQQMRLGTA